MCFSRHTRHTSLIRLIKRVPKRQGLCLLHCKELTVIWGNCWTPTDTTCTASYIRAASVWKPRTRKYGVSTTSETHGRRFGRGLKEWEKYILILPSPKGDNSSDALVLLNKMLCSNYYISSIRTFDLRSLSWSGNSVSYCPSISIKVGNVWRHSLFYFFAIPSVSVWLSQYTDLDTHHMHTHKMNATENILNGYINDMLYMK